MLKKIFLFSLIVLLIGSINSFAYCIHNWSGYTVYVVQKKGARGWPFTFKEYVYKTKCCNWKNYDCNTGRKKDSIVSFDVTLMYDGDFGKKEKICKDFPIKANGDVYIIHAQGLYYCSEEPEFSWNH